MRVFGYELRSPFEREAKANQFESVLQRIVAAIAGEGENVTPHNCMRSPTVHAVVTAVSRRLAVSPVSVYQKGRKNGRDTKEILKDHPIAKLLAAPNEQQTRITYWLDAVSCLMRYGRYYAYKGRGRTGPIRFLTPLDPRAVQVKQDHETFRITYEITNGGSTHDYVPVQIHHVRGGSRDFLTGDSPVEDVRMSIALEIAAEEFGATFFDNGAMPLIIFKYVQGAKSMKGPEDEKRFVDGFQQAFGGKKRHRALLLPNGIDVGDPIRIENDKSQMLETRKYQRTVIAGAFGVPPHLVGDLERATFNNVEQQDQDFTLNVVMPVAQQFESAMESDFLTPEERASGIIIRFNLDSILRADFKGRQEGLQIQKRNNVINANEWREYEGKNPISDEDGGEDYTHESNLSVAGEPPPGAPGAPGSTPVPVEQAPPKSVMHNHIGITIEQGDTMVHSSHQHEAQDVSLTVKSPETVVNAPVTIHAPEISVKMPNVTVYPSETTIQPQQITISHTVEPTEITVHSPKTTVFNDLPELKFPAPVITIEAPTITVEAPVINVAPPEVKVEPQFHITNEVASPDVTVESPVIHVTSPEVKVEPQFHITNDVASPDITVEAPIVTVKAPIVYIDPPQVTVNNAPAAAPIIHVEPTPVTFKAPDVYVDAPQVTVTNEVHPTDVKVDAPVVTFNAPDVYVDAPVVTVHNDVSPTPITVEAPIVNVRAPDVYVEPAEVTIHNDVRPADVKVEPTPVTIVTPAVTVTNEVPAPVVYVDAPEVTVEAPQVIVKNELPEYEVIETEAVRDKNNRITKTITTKKRKKDTKGGKK